MLTNIIQGIANKLNQVFGSEYTIYTESVEEGLMVPCFYIFLLKATEKQIVGNRYKREQPFDIQYLPSTGTPKTECLAVADLLTNALELISVDSEQYRGTKMQFEVVDNVLHFFINYNFFVIKQPDSIDSMETLKIHESLKG